MEILNDALTQHHTSLDLFTMCNNIKKSYKELKKQDKENELIEKNNIKIKKQLKLKQQKQHVKQTHTMVRRSQLKNIMNKEIPSNNERVIMIDHLGVSKCFNCLIIKNKSEFYKVKSSRTGISTVCSDCTYARFNLKPKENFMKHMYSHCKSRAKKKQFKFNLEIQDLYDCYDKQNGKCALSGESMTFIYKRGKREYIRHPTNISLDRIHPKGGYTKDNIQLTTNICNHSKMDLTEEIFINMCQKIVNHKLKQ